MNRKGEFLNGIPIYNVTLEDDADGVFMMSIVDTPAVDSNFLKFNKHRQKVIYHFNDEKRIITGVALRANYPIYRFDGKDEFYVQFTPKDIEIMANKFMKEKKLNNVNVDHNKDVDGIYLIESFILSERHNYPEFEDVDLGSWIVSYKVENQEVWEAIKSGKLNGFSVEITGILSPVKDEAKELIEMYNIINLIEKL